LKIAPFFGKKGDMAIADSKGGFALLIAAGLHLALGPVASATVLYVNVNNPAPLAPYTNWATAAAVIQDAVDAAATGDQIIVTNGIYQDGGRIVAGSLSNRVAVTKPVSIQSVNGAALTIIRGQQVPGTLTGNGAVRCVYLTNGASLSGFMLTNGATRATGDAGTEQSGAGAWCESNAVISACIIVGNRANDSGGGVLGGKLNDCTVTNNSAGYGGGTRDALVTACVVSDNAASNGGGVFGGLINGCTIIGNSAGDAGGGADFCTLTNCVLAGNLAYQAGGGVYAATANNCTITNNWSHAGGGAGSCTLNNCLLTGNSANWAGGSFGGVVNNCTIVGNFAYEAGGIFGGTLNNCIVYYNIVPAQPGAGNFAFGEIPGSMNYSCTTPLPDGGVGNITLEPALASLTHLSGGSPCRGAGTIAKASGVDVDGEPWANPPSMGCDEYNAGASGALTVDIRADNTNVAKGFAVNFIEDIRGNCNSSRWEFGDGTIVSNRPLATHSWPIPGDYPVVLRGYNASFPAGVTTTQIVHVVDGVYYVTLANPNPAAPFTSWATAATNIQDAVDAALPGGTVLVSNGVYRVGGRVVYGAQTNRLVVNKLITVRSVNGPAETAIEGRQTPTNSVGDDAIRCVYLTNHALLSGFTLTNGATFFDGTESFDYRFYSGGGVYCESTSEIVSNCVIVGCAASDYGGGAARGTLENCILKGNFCFHGGNGGGADSALLNGCTFVGNWSSQGGGGASRSTLHRCVLTNNTSGVGGATYSSAVNNCVLTGNAALWGGGDYVSTLNNCTVVNNSAEIGGGANGSTLNNCIVYDNTAPTGSNHISCNLNYSCTFPWPGGNGNFTNAPRFVNEAGANYRLQTNSPCINGGINASSPAGLDLDGNPRIAGGTVDVGAYELPSPGSVIAYWWLQQFGFALDGSADYSDADLDGMNQWQEWRADTDPTNAVSRLVLLSLPATNNASGIVVTWKSVSSRTYFLQRSTNLSNQPTFQTLATGLGGADVTTSYLDATALGRGPYFYRVGVE
jgi:hypothetical protein